MFILSAWRPYSSTNKVIWRSSNLKLANSTNLRQRNTTIMVLPKMLVKSRGAVAVLKQCRKCERDVEKIDRTLNKWFSIETFSGEFRRLSSWLSLFSYFSMIFCLRKLFLHFSLGRYNENCGLLNGTSLMYCLGSLLVHLSDNPRQLLFNEKFKTTKKVGLGLSHSVDKKLSKNVSVPNYKLIDIARKGLSYAMGNFDDFLSYIVRRHSELDKKKIKTSE